MGIFGMNSSVSKNRNLEFTEKIIVLFLQAAIPVVGTSFSNPDY